MRGVIRIAVGFLIGAVGLAARPNLAGFADWPAGLTRADVMVDDAAGGVVSGLAQGDFQVLSDGQPVPIALFSPAAAPLAVVVLVDVTASLDGNVLANAGLPSSGLDWTHEGRIQPAALAFPLRGVDAADRARFGSIGRTLHLSEPIGGDSKDIPSRWGALFGRPPIDWLGPSPIWDAMWDATEWCRGEPGHRTVILISDGEASGNVHGVREVAERASLAAVSLNVVGEETLLLPQALRAAGIDPSKALQAIAEATGGRYRFVPLGSEIGARDRSLEISKTVQQVLDGLHHAYTLGFVPPVVDGKPHTLEIRVKRPGVTAHARKIY